MMPSLTLSMLREHRWSYAGLSAVLVVSAFVVGSSFALVESAEAGDVDVSGLTANQAALLLNTVAGGRSVGNYVVVLGAFVAFFLVAQTMNFVVEGRRRELALLRLSGASQWQVTRMILVESAIIGVVCALIGGLLAGPFVGPYSAILVSQGNWAAEVPVELRLSAVLWCVVVMTLVTVVGAFSAAFRIGRTLPVDAVRTVAALPRRMSPVRWAFAGAGLVVVTIFLLAPVQSVNFQLSTIIVGGGAVLAVSALAPLVVPFLARLIGGLVSLVAPGAGLVAREHTVHNARRTAALATPIILLLAMGSVFGMLAQTSRETSSVALRNLTNVHAVAVLLPGGQSGDDTYQQAQQLAEVGSLTRVQRTEEWSWDEPGMPPDRVLNLMQIDPATFARFVPAEFITGSIDDIHGNNVAAIGGAADVGETLHLMSPDGTALTVRVVADVQTNRFVHGSLLIDSDALRTGTRNHQDIWLAEPAPGTSDEQLHTALTESLALADVMTHAEWLDQTIADEVEGQSAALVTIISGAVALTLVALVQSSLASVRDRRPELELLTRIGARRRSVVGAVIIEAAITAVTAGLLAIAITALAYTRMATALNIMNPTLTVIVPIDILAVVLTACIVISTGAAALGSTLALHRIKVLY